MRRTLPVWVAAVLCGSALVAPAVRAADFIGQLDPPVLSFVNSGRGSLQIQVTPGGSGAPAGFTVEWLPLATYESLGGWPDESDSRIQRSAFTGMPTLNTTDGTTQYRLTSVDDAGVELGDLFDETGILTSDTDQLLEGTGYVVRAWANAFGLYAPSVPSSQIVGETQTSAGHDCTYTLGYWKNHGEVWPATSLKLGNVTYTQTQLMQIYARAAKGNGLVSLAHQLIAAKLNIANGASVPPAVATAIAQADALIGNLVVPSIGNGALAPSATSGLTETLDEYNNGELGPDHCSSIVPTANTTWGRVKMMYR